MCCGTSKPAGRRNSIVSLTPPIMRAARLSPATGSSWPFQLERRWQIEGSQGPADCGRRSTRPAARREFAIARPDRMGAGWPERALPQAAQPPRLENRALADLCPGRCAPKAGSRRRRHARSLHPSRRTAHRLQRGAGQIRSLGPGELPAEVKVFRLPRYLIGSRRRLIPRAGLRAPAGAGNPGPAGSLPGDPTSPAFLPSGWPDPATGRR